MDPLFASREEICNALKISKSTFFRLIKEGRPADPFPSPIIKRGNLVRWNWREVIAWFERGRVPSTLCV